MPRFDQWTSPKRIARREEWLKQYEAKRAESRTTVRYENGEWVVVPA